MTHRDEKRRAGFSPPHRTSGDSRQARQLRNFFSPSVAARHLPPQAGEGNHLCVSPLSAQLYRLADSAADAVRWAEAHSPYVFCRECAFIPSLSPRARKIPRSTATLPAYYGVENPFPRLRGKVARSAGRGDKNRKRARHITFLHKPMTVTSQNDHARKHQ